MKSTTEASLLDPHTDRDRFAVPVEPSTLPPPGQVVVLAGGLSHERDVSLRSGRRVAQALRSRGLDVVESDVDSNLVPQLKQAGDDVVIFPVLHGEAGEDGSLREVLGLLGVAFVGSVGSACRVAFDKSIATTVVAEAGLVTPPQVALPHEIFRELGAAALVKALGEVIGFPMMVKPRPRRVGPGLPQGRPGRRTSRRDGRRLRVRIGRGRRVLRGRDRGHRRGG